MAVIDQVFDNMSFLPAIIKKNPKLDPKIQLS